MTSPPRPRGLIAVMGSTGSGKSSFANAILGRHEATVGAGLESSTDEVGQYVHYHESGMEVRIVDTPGFNDYRAESTKSDLKILQMIANFLKNEYDANQKFSGIIFLHNINTAKVDWQSQRRNMTLFKKLCGTECMKNIVVITSFWDELSDMNYGIQRETDLQTQDGLLKELYVGGAKFVRSGHFEPGKQPHDPAFFTPAQVVDYLLSLDPVYLEMQMEMAEGASIAETAAGSSLLEDFETLKRETRESLDKMRLELESIRSADDVNRSHREELKRETQKMQERLTGWEKDGDEMRLRVNQWEEYQTRIATKEELGALVSSHQKEIGDLQHEVMKLREANDKLRQIDQQRIDELNQALVRLRKDRDDLAEECKALRSGNHNQFQGFTASLTEITRTYNRETGRLQGLLASQGADLNQAKLACEQAKKELEATDQLYMKSEAELRKMEMVLESSQQEFARWKESHEKLSCLYDALDAEYNETLAVSAQHEGSKSEMEVLRQELQQAVSEKQALESRNGELERAMKEATLTADDTAAAAEEFRLRLSTEADETIASMEREARDLRSVNERSRADLQQCNEEIAKLREELESLRRQQATPMPQPTSNNMAAFHLSPPADDPYSAWNNPTGVPLSVGMPGPSFASSPPPLPPRPYQGSSQPSYPSYPKPTPPLPVPSPASANLHLDINIGHGYQGLRRPHQQQQQQQGPARVVPRASRANHPQIPPRSSPVARSGSPAIRSQTPLAPQPSFIQRTQV